MCKSVLYLLENSIYWIETIEFESGTVWPVKSCQMSVKVAQKWFHKKMKDFDTFTQIAYECRRFGQNNQCQRLWKVALSSINHPIWSHWSGTCNQIRVFWNIIFGSWTALRRRSGRRRRRHYPAKCLFNERHFPLVSCEPKVRLNVGESYFSYWHLLPT